MRGQPGQEPRRDRWISRRSPRSQPVSTAASPFVSFRRWGSPTISSIDCASRASSCRRASAAIHRFASHTETWRQRVMAATLALPGSIASHRTAAVLWDLEGFHPGKIELIVEHGGWRARDVLVHQSRDLVGGDFDVRYGIPCTSLIRTLIDLPAVAWEARCGQALDHACRNDRSVLKRVRARHLEVARRGRNGTVMLRALLERRGEGRLTDSGFEDKALHLITEACLPEPVTQHPVRHG